MHCHHTGPVKDKEAGPKWTGTSARLISTVTWQKYDGDSAAMVEGEIKVYRLPLSEQDRIGIGTFQPKDEKNQSRLDQGIAGSARS